MKFCASEYDGVECFAIEVGRLLPNAYTNTAPVGIVGSRPGGNPLTPRAFSLPASVIKSIGLGPGMVLVIQDAQQPKAVQLDDPLLSLCPDQHKCRHLVHASDGVYAVLTEEQIAELEQNRKDEALQAREERQARDAELEAAQVAAEQVAAAEQAALEAESIAEAAAAAALAEEEAAEAALVEAALTEEDAALAAQGPDTQEETPEEQEETGEADLSGDAEQVEPMEGGDAADADEESDAGEEAPVPVLGEESADEHTVEGVDDSDIGTDPGEEGVDGVDSAAVDALDTEEQE